MNIPNMISIFRILLIPVFIASFMVSSRTGSVTYPVIVFIIAGISDIADGYIARKYNMKTDLGAVLDPLADKLMLITALICFAWYRYIPVWIVVLVAIKELTMIVGGFLTFRKGIVTPANVLGKVATIFFHISIVTFLFSDKLAVIFLIVSIVVSFAALFNYGRITHDKRKARRYTEPGNTVR